jgi:hypothetical protein
LSSDRPEAYAIRDEIQTKGAHFFNAAVKYWQEEYKQPSLTTAAAGVLMMAYQTSAGGDQGLLYLHAGMRVAHERGIFSQKAQDLKKHHDARARLAYNTTAWGLYYYAM